MLKHIRIGKLVFDLERINGPMQWSIGLSTEYWTAERLWWRFYWVVEFAPTCDECGGRPAIACYTTDGWLKEPREVSEHLCSRHAELAGYCGMCGLFSSGIDTFDFGSHAGLCDTCADEIESDCYDGDDEYECDTGDISVP